MNSKQLKYTQEILKIKGIKQDVSRLTPKENKLALKKLRKTLKDLEFLRRMGGVTVIIEGGSIITTYYNNSMYIKLNNNKVIY